MQNFSFTKMHLKIWSVKWQPFFPGGDELRVKSICNELQKKHNKVLNVCIFLGIYCRWQIIWMGDRIRPWKIWMKFLKRNFHANLIDDGWGILGEIALRWMSLDLTLDKSTLVEVMVCCHQATSHYLSQCLCGSMSLYSVTRPQWMKSLWPMVTQYGTINFCQRCFWSWWLAACLAIGQ